MRLFVSYAVVALLMENASSQALRSKKRRQLVKPLPERILQENEDDDEPMPTVQPSVEFLEFMQSGPGSRDMPTPAPSVIEPTVAPSDAPNEAPFSPSAPAAPSAPFAPFAETDAPTVETDAPSSEPSMGEGSGEPSISGAPSPAGGSVEPSISAFPSISAEPSTADGSTAPSISAFPSISNAPSTTRGSGAPSISAFPSISEEPSTADGSTAPSISAFPSAPSSVGGSGAPSVSAFPSISEFPSATGGSLAPSVSASPSTGGSLKPSVSAFPSISQFPSVSAFPSEFPSLGQDGADQGQLIPDNPTAPAPTVAVTPPTQPPTVAANPREPGPAPTPVAATPRDPASPQVRPIIRPGGYDRPGTSKQWYKHVFGYPHRPMGGGHVRKHGYNNKYGWGPRGVVDKQGKHHFVFPKRMHNGHPGNKHYNGHYKKSKSKKSKSKGSKGSRSSKGDHYYSYGYVETMYETVRQSYGSKYHHGALYPHNR